MERRLSADQAAMALTSDYQWMYYVDLETETYTEYAVEDSCTNLRKIRSGSQFFAQMQKVAGELLSAEDQKLFRDVFKPENILGAIHKLGAYILTFRVPIDNTLTWMQLKAVCMNGNQKDLLIGISNVDYFMNLRENYERLDREKEMYSRFAALSGKYICINTIDLETNNYTEYRALETDYEGLGLPRRGEDFFRDLQKNGHRMICSEDLPLFYSAFSRDNILSEIQKRGIFTLNYRIMFGTEPRYVCMRAIITEEHGRKLLVVGLSDIDAEVKQNQEYSDNLLLARSQATRDSLTGVKNKLAYTEMMDQLSEKIKAGSADPFAILVFDVNDLKHVNDTYGHHAGDEYLQEACAIICDTFKHSPVFRIGGDEFAVIATGIDYHNVYELLEQITEANRKNRQTKKPVIACGIAMYEKNRPLEELFERADTRMYENKKRLKSLGNLQ